MPIDAHNGLTERIACSGSPSFRQPPLSCNSRKSGSSSKKLVSNVRFTSDSSHSYAPADCPFRFRSLPLNGIGVATGSEQLMTTTSEQSPT